MPVLVIFVFPDQPSTMRKNFWRLAIAIILLIIGLHTFSSVRAFTPQLQNNPSIPFLASQPQIDLTHLPLGDGKIANEPKAGWIWACRIDPNAGGAFRNGTWIKDDGTYDFTAKPIVNGAVTWRNKFVMKLAGE